MAQWLKSPAALLEDPGLICITHMAVTTICNSSFGGSDTFRLYKYQVHILCTCIDTKTPIT